MVGKYASETGLVQHTSTYTLYIKDIYLFCLPHIVQLFNSSMRIIVFLFFVMLGWPRLTRIVDRSGIAPCRWRVPRFPLCGPHKTVCNVFMVEKHGPKCVCVYLHAMSMNDCVCFFSNLIYVHILWWMSAMRTKQNTIIHRMTYDVPSFSVLLSCIMCYLLLATAELNENICGSEKHFDSSRFCSPLLYSTDPVRLSVHFEWRFVFLVRATNHSGFSLYNDELLTQADYRTFYHLSANEYLAIFSMLYVRSVQKEGVTNWSQSWSSPWCGSACCFRWKG